MIHIKQISVHELKEKLDRKDSFKLIDVREKEENDLCRIEGSILLPLSEISARAAKELGPQDEIVVHCHHGGRSQRACEYLYSLGIKNVANLSGGIDQWSEKIDPNVPRY